MTDDLPGAGPPAAGLAREPDGRGRRATRVGRVRTGGRAVRRVDRRTRGRRATRRRPRRLPRQGRVDGSRQRERGDRRRDPRGGTPPTSEASTRHSSSSTGRRRRAGSARMRFSAARLRRRRQPRRTPGSRSTAGWAATEPGPLPVPMLNVVNGGAHAQNRLDLPGVHGRARWRGDRSPRRFVSGPRSTTHLKSVLRERGLATGVGDEGGFAPDLESTERAIETILDAAERAGHRDRVAIALDPAASEVYRDGAYHLPGEGRTLDPSEMIDFYGSLSERFPRRLDRGRARRGRVERLAATHGGDRRARSSWSGTISS